MIANTRMAKSMENVKPHGPLEIILKESILMVRDMD